MHMLEESKYNADYRSLWIFGIVSIFAFQVDLSFEQEVYVLFP